MTLNLVGWIGIKRPAGGGGADLANFKGRRGTAGNGFQEREASDRILRFSISPLDADEQILSCRLADLNADPAATTEVAAGETHKCTCRRVLRIKIDVAGKRRSARPP